MSTLRIIGIFVFALAAGCTGEKNAPAKVAVAPAAAEQPRSNENALAAARPLDMPSLRARLRDTLVIGAFTKLALRNEMDDLLQKFRVHYQRGQQAGVVSLRQPYDMLILKMLALIQDGDPSLASAISGSWEAIWGNLADPGQFNAAAQPST